MNLKQQLQDDIKNAMKQKETEKLSVLRLVMDTIIKKEKELKEEIDDQAVTKLIMGAVKRGQDSISQFKEGNRNDLVEKEERELAILKNYLPEQMSEQEIRSIVQKVIDGGADNIGMVMKGVMPQTQGKADGKLVTDIVKELLG
jgi:uncharacterized protein